MKNRVILVSSVLQVINSMAAIKYMNYEDEDKFFTYIIIIHPSLNDNAKKSIEHYSSKFKFKVIDLSNIFDEEKKPKNNYQKNFLKFLLFKLQNLKRNYIFNNNIRPKKISKISNILKKIFNNVDEIFLRTNYKILDLAFYEALIPVKKILLIEDGNYDFREKNYLNTRLTVNEIKQSFFHLSYMYLIFFISLVNSLNLKKSIKQNINYKIKFNYKFNTFKNKRSIDIGEFTKNIFHNYSDLTSNKNNKLAIIVGTVFWDWQMNIEDEIIIYNKLIDKIKSSFMINNDQIYYKPHPRCGNIDIKKNKLQCAVLDNDNYILVEEYFSKKNISSVFSFGSTSLIYCRTLFNIPSYFIDINNYIGSDEKFDYSYFLHHDFSTFNKFGIKKILIN